MSEPKSPRFSNIQKCDKCSRHFVRKFIQENVSMVSKWSKDKTHRHVGNHRVLYGRCSLGHYTEIEVVGIIWQKCFRCRARRQLQRYREKYEQSKIDTKNDFETSGVNSEPKLTPRTIATQTTQTPSVHDVSIEDEFNKLKADVKRAIEQNEEKIEQRIREEVTRRLRNIKEITDSPQTTTRSLKDFVKLEKELEKKLEQEQVVLRRLDRLCKRPIFDRVSRSLRNADKGLSSHHLSDRDISDGNEDEGGGNQTEPDFDTGHQTLPRRTKSVHFADTKHLRLPSRRLSPTFICPLKIQTN